MAAASIKLLATAVVMPTAFHAVFRNVRTQSISLSGCRACVNAPANAARLTAAKAADQALAVVCDLPEALRNTMAYSKVCKLKATSVNTVVGSAMREPGFGVAGLLR